MPTTPSPGPAQGDLRLLDTPEARELLARAIPARLAYVTPGGAPRIVPTWFHWNGTEIVMPTWISGPHIQHPARRVRHLRERPEVAISIDTEDQPPVVLQIRGQATIDEIEGVADEYRSSALRYLGAEAGGELLAELDGVPVTMARVAVRPEWVGLLDFRERLPSPLGGVVGAG
jgi:hypothetical protein